MLSRYLTASALTLALLTIVPAAAAVPRHGHKPAETRKPAPVLMTAQDLYSRRALRQAKIILELKLLELRSERLECVRKAIERNIPIDTLLSGE